MKILRNTALILPPFCAVTVPICKAFDQELAHSLPKTTDDFLELPAGALTGIIIGCKADKNTVETINDVVQDCQPSVKIRPRSNAT